MQTSAGREGKEAGAHNESTRGNARPGMVWSPRINGEVASGRRLKMRSGTTLQGFRRGVARWGGRGDRGGASERIGEARQWLWPRQQRAAVTTVLGHERKESRGREKLRESERAIGRAAWRHLKRPGRSGKQEVAWRASPMRPSSWQGGRRQWRGQVAGPATWAAR